MTTNIVVFKGKEIRKTIHNNEWWFVISDIVEVLAETKNVKQYIKDMRRRDEELGKGWVQIATPLLIETPGGKQKLKHLFSQLGEESTKEISKTMDAQGFNENQIASQQGGQVCYQTPFGIN